MIEILCRPQTHHHLFVIVQDWYLTYSLWLVPCRGSNWITLVPLIYLYNANLVDIKVEKWEENRVILENRTFMDFGFSPCRNIEYPHITEESCSYEMREFDANVNLIFSVMWSYDYVSQRNLHGNVRFLPMWILAYQIHLKERLVGLLLMEEFVKWLEEERMKEVKGQKRNT